MQNRLLPQSVILVVATAFLGYWALLVYCDVWRPLPLGLLLRFEDDRVMVVGTVPGSPADRAGLRAADRVALVDGYPIRGRLDWMAVETNLEIGRATPLSVERNGEVIAAPVTLSELASWESWRSRYGPTLMVVRAVQLVTLLLALTVALKRSRDPVAIVGSIFLATIGVFSLTLPFRLASVWRGIPLPAAWLLWLPFMSSVTMAAWACAFFLMFPRTRFRSPLAWIALWIPIVPGLFGQAVFGYYSIVLGRPAPSLLPWTRSLVVVGVAYIVAGLSTLLGNYRRLVDVNERRRVRVVLLGSLVGALGGMPVVLSYWRAAASQLDQSFLAAPFATLGTFLFLALPLSFAYAILRHRLFDISVMVRQGLRYALARYVLLAFVPGLLILLGIDLFAHGDQPVGDIFRSRGWLYVSLAILAVLARSRRQRWLASLDRRFFRESYNAQRLLRAVAEDVRQAPNLEPAAPTVVARIEQALHSRFVALLLRDESGRRYRTVAASPTGLAPDSLAADNKVVALVRLLGKPVDVSGSETEWLARKLPEEDARSMLEAAIDLVVPVGSAEGDAKGLIVLGAKRSEEPYSEDDLELLMAIAENVAMRLPPAGATGDPVSERFEECPTCGVCYEPGTARCRTEGTSLVTMGAPRLLAGRYRLEQRLGRGGMGTVYAALDLSLDRRVAAKLVRDDLVGVPDAAERFRREARIAAAFSHPNVVTVHDFGIAGSQAFIVMELLEGQTLRDVLRAEGRLEWPRALAILTDVAAAVEAAHRRRLVHRDLKPENIGLVSYGSGERAKVLDFGIAKLFTLPGDDLSNIHTTGGPMLGTPWYMAPEQLRGEEPDPSWDLWALAVIAFEMLSASHPFATATLGWPSFARELTADPRLSHLPSGVQQFFACGLALDRTARPLSPAAFLSALERSLHA